MQAPSSARPEYTGLAASPHALLLSPHVLLLLLRVRSLSLRALSLSLLSADGFTERSNDDGRIIT